jgi:hypothetical protein
MNRLCEGDENKKKEKEKRRKRSNQENSKQTRHVFHFNQHLIPGTRVVPEETTLFNK